MICRQLAVFNSSLYFWRRRSRRELNGNNVTPLLLSGREWRLQQVTLTLGCKMNYTMCIDRVIPEAITIETSHDRK